MTQLQYKYKYKYDEQKRFEDFVKSFGYTRRINSYFIVRENDGYINVHREFPSVQIYHFHKNHYQGIDKKDITFSTSHFSKFINYMCSYHKKEGRIKKLKQIEYVNKIP